MNNLKKHAVLYVDDEEKSLKYFAKGYKAYFRIFTAENTDAAWDIIDEHGTEIGVVMSDQRMPKETGVQLFERLRTRYPAIVRILVTGYSDLDSAIEAVNTGAIYKYIQKPWDIQQLRITLMRALEFFEIQSQRDGLLKEKMSVFQRLMIANERKDLAIFGGAVSAFFPNSVTAIRSYLESAKRCPSQPPAISWMDMDDWGEYEGRNLYYLADRLRGFAQTIKSSAPQMAVKIADVVDELVKRGGSSYTVVGSDEFPEIAISRSALVSLLSSVCDSVAHGSGSTRILIGKSEHPGDVPAGMIELRINDGTGPWDSDRLSELHQSEVNNDGRVTHPGLDLAACFILASALGGTISIEGREDVKVLLRLPIEPAEMDALDSEAELKTLTQMLQSDLTVEPWVLP